MSWPRDFINFNVYLSNKLDERHCWYMGLNGSNCRMSGQDSRMRIEENFAIEKMVPRYLTLWQMAAVWTKTG
jgi:hypothetical protein